MKVESMIAGFALIAATGLATEAAAMSQREEVRSLTVSVADLQLSGEHGARQALRRIERAAHRVCRSPSRVQLHEKTAEAQCAKRAMSEAVARIDQPVVTALYTDAILPTQLAAR